MDETLKNQLEILIRFWERSSEPWEVKDSQSRYIYANPRAHRFVSLPAKYKIEGRLDGDLPSPIAEFQDEFQRQDR
ncbi:TPA: PAS domain-containing protein, partial [Yersinia enterocolitica]|nr:PAS domain-containing protein [Yersinia enterocolitica]